jgi:hypothetical protein
MQLPVWLSQPRSPQFGVVRKGTEDDLLSLMLHQSVVPLTIVCDRFLCERVSLSAAMWGHARPSVLISRGFKVDLDTLLAMKPKQPVLVCASVLRAHLANERDRFRTQTRMLAGYEVAGEAIDTLTYGRFAASTAAISKQSPMPIAVHDEGGEVPRGLLSAQTVFEYPDAGTGQKDNPPVAAAPVDRPADETILEHARFLDATEPAILGTLHGFLAGSDHQAVFGIWDQNLSCLEATPGRSELARSARRKLAAVQASVSLQVQTGRRDGGRDAPRRATRPAVAA